MGEAARMQPLGTPWLIQGGTDFNTPEAFLERFRELHYYIEPDLEEALRSISFDTKQPPHDIDLYETSPHSLGFREPYPLLGRGIAKAIEAGYGIPGKEVPFQFREQYSDHDFDGRILHFPTEVFITNSGPRRICVGSRAHGRNDMERTITTFGGANNANISLHTSLVFVH